MRIDRRHLRLLVVAATMLWANVAGAQSELPGPPLAGRTSDTGHTALINSSGGFSQSIPFDFPAERTGLPLPVHVVYGGRRLGTAGIGWDLPLSYITREIGLGHRLPTIDANGNILEAERLTLVLDGVSQPLMRKGGPQSPTWVPYRDGTQIEVLDSDSINITMFDGNGRRYVFSNVGPGRASPRLDGGDLYLLRQIYGTGGDVVQLLYDNSRITLADGSSALVIHLQRVTYNPSRDQQCPKNVITMGYGLPATSPTPSTVPLSLTMLQHEVLAQIHVLTKVDVHSRDSCAGADVILRSYLFQYPDAGDVDTGLPQLNNVIVSGRADRTPENTTYLPVATYTYGSAATATAPQPAPMPELRYQKTYSIPLRNAAVGNHLGHSQGSNDGTIDTWNALIDMNGDGAPDLVYRNGGQTMITPNTPDGNSAPGVPLSNLRSFDFSMPGQDTGADSPFSGDDRQLGHQTTVRTSADSIHDDHGETVNVWRQLIDFNGDGRLDIIDAAEQDGKWVVYLNEPAVQSPAGIFWLKRVIDVTPMMDALRQQGFSLDSHLPLQRRHTGREWTRKGCMQWHNDDQIWVMTDLGADCKPGTPEPIVWGKSKSYVEWELRDLNGDGYPDFLFDGTTLFDGAGPPENVAPLINIDQKSPNATQQHWVTTAYHRADLGDPNSAPEPTTPDRSGVSLFVSYNVAGVHLRTDDVTSHAFSLPLLLSLGPVPGVGFWQGRIDGAEAGVAAAVVQDTQTAGFLDFNGDALADYFNNTTAFLQDGDSGFIVTVALPTAPESESQDDNVQACGRTKNHTRTSGLRDLNGDGIPDLLENTQTVSGNRFVYIPTVRFGTGSGFGPAIPIKGVPLLNGALYVSHETVDCSSGSSDAFAGVYDVDGDGKPEVLVESSGQLDVYQLTDDQGWGSPDAGQLTQVYNGYGATTKITYGSDKDNEYAGHQVPFPEIVVTSVTTLNSSTAAPLATLVHYSYGTPEMMFDTVDQRFVFAGYRRTVTLNAESGGQKAVITDLNGLAPYSLISPPSHEQRFLDYAVVGRPRDVRILNGMFIGKPFSGDPRRDVWTLLGIEPAFPIENAGVLRIGGAHYEYGSKVFQEDPPTACFEQAFPYDDTASQNIAVDSGFYPCAAYGLAYTQSVDTWRGTSAPPSPMTDNMSSHLTVTSVDDFGRVLASNEFADHELGYDTTVAFASPEQTGPPWVLNAPSSHVVKRRNTDQIAWSETWEYDGLPVGSVSSGLTTAHTVQRANNGGSITLGQLRVEYTNDPTTGVPLSMTTAREDQNGAKDGASRTVSTEYDPFSIAPTRVTVTATDVPGARSIPPQVTELALDPYTLQVVGRTDTNQTAWGTRYDGYGRPVLTTVATPGSAPRALSVLSYYGFSLGETRIRRVSRTEFTDPVAFSEPVDLVTLAMAPGGRAAVGYMDELGRNSRTVVSLGSDYQGQRLTVGMRAYDAQGRIAFAADPFPSTQDASTAYGISYFYHSDGSPSCGVRANGPLAGEVRVTNEGSEIYPACVDHSYVDNLEVTNTQAADSLLAGSPQAGLIQTTTQTTWGSVLNRSTAQKGTPFEYTEYAYGLTGEQNAMLRFLDPATRSSFTASQYPVDSLGQILQIQETGNMPRDRTYSNWGELMREQWVDAAVSPQTEHLALKKYDALGRIVHSEEQKNVHGGDSPGWHVDPETVHDYSYDQSVTVGPLMMQTSVTTTNVVGKLSQARSPTSTVSFGYDAWGHVTDRVFTDDEDNYYFESHAYHVDGSLEHTELKLPDTGYLTEQVFYKYDSAGRMSSVLYLDGVDDAASEDLFEASAIDPWGRIRTATYGGELTAGAHGLTYTATYAETGRRLPASVIIDGPQNHFEFKFGPDAAGLSAFDPLGRERRRTEVQDSTVVQTSSYDAIGRLASSSSTSGAAVQVLESYSYDALGNRLKVEDGTSSPPVTKQFGYNQVDDLDRLCTIDDGSGQAQAGCSVVHDGVGNIVRMPTRGGGTRTLDYLANGRVRTIIDSSGNTAHYKYDAFDDVESLELTAVDLNNTRSDRHYGELIHRRMEQGSSGLGSVITRTIPLPDGFMATRHGGAAAQGSSGRWFLTFGEPKGNRLAFDQQNLLAQRVTYRPFGEATSTPSAHRDSSYSSLQWNGGDSLEAFGVSQLGARLYDSVIGRFLSRDPLMVPNTAAKMNPYAFSTNDPVNMFDPSGMCSGPQDVCVPPPFPVVPCLGIVCLPSDGGSSGKPGNAPYPLSAPIRGFVSLHDGRQPQRAMTAYERERARVQLADRGLVSEGLGPIDYIIGGPFGRGIQLGEDIYDALEGRQLSPEEMLDRFMGAQLGMASGGSVPNSGPGGAPTVPGAGAAGARGGTYVLRDNEDNIVRSGRSNNLDRRESEHARNPVLKDYKFDVWNRTDSRAEQRGLEQIIHDTYHPALNKVAPISRLNPLKWLYMRAARLYYESGGS